MSFAVRQVHEKSAKNRRIAWLKALRTITRVCAPFIAWYASYRHQKEQRKNEKKCTRIVQKIFMSAIAISLAILLGTFFISSLSLLRFSSFSFEKNDAVLSVDTNGRTNILLLGEGDETGQYLTDAIIVASLDPDTRSIGLLSFPRDLYFLHTDTMGEGRLNSLYRDYFYSLRRSGIEEKEASNTAMKELMKESGKALNIDIHYGIKVNFAGFIQAVDAIGGITLSVPYDIVDPEYPGPNYTVEPFEIQKGIRHFDGETALKYARSRNTTSDFSRSERQQMLLKALGKKMKKEGLFQKPNVLLSLFQTMQEYVQTTMSISELVAFAIQGRSILPENIYAMQLHDRNGLYDDVLEPGGLLYTPPRDLFDGASVLLPVSIPEFPVTWKQIHTLAYLFFTIRSLHLQKPSIAILNAGAPSGYARFLGNELKKFGMNVLDIRNAETKQVTSALYAPSQNSIGNTLATILNIPFQQGPYAGDQHDIVVVLGKDYHYFRMQDLLAQYLP